MRVLIAGATGVIGRPLVPLLRAAGHDVAGLARSDRAADALTAAGARPVRADALDAEAVRRAVGEAAPDAVVHLLTAIPADPNPRRMRAEFAPTDRLRDEGTRNLLDAAGGARFVAQSIAFAYQPAPGLADEDAGLWTDGTPRQFASALDAVRSLERQVTGAGGVALRFGHLYGDGSAWAPDGAMTRRLRDGKLPLVGGGDAVYSFTHAGDAASAVVAALDRPVGGVLNVVDDDPAPLHEVAGVVAGRVGGPAPRRLPAALARLAVGAWGVAYLNELRGADNARARLRLDWRPRHTTWRDRLGA
ncbi:NAD-dependent epimerase/dehydratase family protein [Actinomadura flavalba]|uniref:NAD-dependent epimerase/dehydratase family protein n=1 Tax=Actinomadura flavalba TaxID=1120938 RepID=UPI0003613F07|nr:NAD(P)-dependent oxidoreductase [Actinomadura flavalba]